MLSFKSTETNYGQEFTHHLYKNVAESLKSGNLGLIQKDWQTSCREWMKKRIKSTIRQQILATGTSPTRDHMSWLEANLSIFADSDYLTEILSGMTPAASKVMVNLFRNNDEIPVETLSQNFLTLKNNGISAVTLANGNHPPHSKLDLILGSLSKMDFIIKLVVQENGTERFLENFAKNLHHLKVCFQLSKTVNDPPEFLSHLEAIHRTAKELNRSIKTHLEIQMEIFDVESLLVVLQKAIQSEITQISIELSKLTLSSLEYAKIKSIQTQYQTQIQIWVSPSKLYRKYNTKSTCWVPKMRWVLGPNQEISSCTRYPDSNPKTSFFRQSLEKSSDSNSLQKTIQSLSKKIDGKQCRYCGPADKSINLQVRKFVDSLNLTAEERSLVKIPTLFQTPSTSPNSLLELELGNWISKYKSSAHSFIKNLEIPLDAKSTQELSDHHLKYALAARAHEKMFQSYVAQKGRRLISEYCDNSSSKISDNVVVVKDSSTFNFSKIFANSVIISENIPLEFLKSHIDVNVPTEDIHLNVDDRLQLDEIISKLKKRPGTKIIGIGGGHVADLIKFVSWKTEAESISIPTSLATHVYASPKIHALPLVQTYGHRLTIDASPSHLSILASDLLEKLESSNPRLLSAGLGDLLAFVTSKRDWELSIRAGKDIKNPFVNDLIDTVVERIQSIDLKSPIQDWIEEYVKVQVLLCNITDWCGSAPASGSEHLFAKCLENEIGDSILHGEAVALGVLIYGSLHKVELQSLVSFMDSIQISRNLDHFNISKKQIVEAMIEASEYGRFKKRYTICEELNLKRESLSSHIDTLISEDILQTS